MTEHSRLRKMQVGRLHPSEGNRDSSTDTPSLAPQQNQADRVGNVGVNRERASR